MKFPKVSPELAKKADIHKHIQKQYAEDWVYYVIDSKFRKATLLRRWLQDQVLNPSEAMKAFANSIPNHAAHDDQVRAVLQAVRNAVEYVGDGELWDMNEYWSTAEETLTARKGDCEDGAILMYVLCRLKGVPENRLMLFAGDVANPWNKSTVGHCWLGYRPDLYPLNFVFLDWCYYYDPNTIDRRELFYIHNQTIYGSKSQKYKTIWFAFNEEVSHRRLVYDNHNR